MPYHINSTGPGKFEIVDDAGKVVGTHPTRKQALEQLKALYANVPEARKETGQQIDLSTLNGDGMYTEKSSSDPGDYLIVEDREKPTTWHLQVRKNGQPDHGLMGAAWAALHEGYRGNVYEGPDKGKALDKLKALYAAEKMDTPATKEAQTTEPQLSLIDRIMIAIKGDKPGHEFRGNQFGRGSGGGSSESGLSGKVKKLTALSTGAVGKMGLDEVSGVIDDVNSVTGDSGYNSIPHESHQHIMGISQAAHGRRRELKLGRGEKEGRRNSSPDGDRLQQIHDLAVLNGASCPMVMKEASGKLRWVLLSSNAFQDSDKEIISQKALEADVARTDKEQAPYGPLRWWHMGDPDPIGLKAGSGADIGDCDYRAMSGRVLIESGTFRNEQIGAAVKDRADTLAGSIGFFHPKDEPDSEGVYQNIVQFERSLLPRGKASNTLTALTVKGDQDMATSKEKADALAALLGDQSLAESVIKQAEATEKAADDRGLKYKEAEVATKAPTGTVTAVPATGASGINPIGLAKDEKAKPAEGEPGEEKTEPKKEAESEPDWEALAKGLAPHINRMIEEKMKASAKEIAEKDKGLQASIDAIAADVKELKGDLPRGFNGFRPSLAQETILSNVNVKAQGGGNGDLESVIDQLMGLKAKQ